MLRCVRSKLPTQIRPLAPRRAVLEEKLRPSLQRGPGTGVSSVVGLNPGRAGHVPASNTQGGNRHLCPWLLSPNTATGAVPKISMESSLMYLRSLLQAGGLVNSQQGSGSPIPSQPAAGKGWVQRYSSNPAPTLSCTWLWAAGKSDFFVLAALSFWSFGAGECNWGEAVKWPWKWQVLQSSFN